MCSSFLYFTASEISTNYPYKAILDLLVYSPAGYLRNGAKSFLYSKDSAGNMDKTIIDGEGGNSGLIDRFQFTKGGAECLLRAPIFHDLFQMSEYLLPGLELKLRFWPSSDNFVLMSGEAETSLYWVEIQDIVLQMTGIEVTENLRKQHLSMLNRHNAIYHMKSSVLKTFAIPPNLKTWNLNNIFNSEIPSDILIAFVESDSAVGSMKKNPYNFKHFNLNFLSLSIEGMQTRTFRPDYAKKFYRDEFDALFEADHGLMQTFEPIFTAPAMVGGYAIYR